MESPNHDSPRSNSAAVSQAAFGKAVIVVVPIAIGVACWVISYSWTLALAVSLVAAVLLWGLLKALQPLTDDQPEDKIVAIRDRKHAVPVVVVMLGMVTGGVVGFAALVAGFHGNFPLAWLYLCGPVAWLLLLGGSDVSYLYLLGILMPLTWMAYWAYVIVGAVRVSEYFFTRRNLRRSKEDDPRPPRWEQGVQRAVLVVLFHLLSAGSYHALVGLP